MSERPICHVVAGPNGSGKSTFALRYLPEYAGAVEYVNPDLMAQGMSPTDIRLSAIKAGKLTLERIAELIEARTSFAFETTLSGRGHLKLLADAKNRGYTVVLYYLWMPEPAALPLRISHRVIAGARDLYAMLSRGRTAPGSRRLRSGTCPSTPATGCAPPWRSR